jgi:hypothetical protein
MTAANDEQDPEGVNIVRMLDRLRDWTRDGRRDRIRAIERDRNDIAHYLWQHAKKTATQRDRMPAEVAEDIAQDVVPKFLEKLLEPETSLRPKGWQGADGPVSDVLRVRALKSWLAVLVKYKVRAIQRKLQQRANTGPITEAVAAALFDRSSSPPDEAHAREALRRAVADLDKLMADLELPDEVRAMVRLRVLEGNSWDEVARVLGISPEDKHRRLVKPFSGAKSRLKHHRGWKWFGFLFGDD